MFELIYLLAIPSVLLLTLCASELLYLKIKKTLTECQSQIIKDRKSGNAAQPTKAFSISAK